MDNIMATKFEIKSGKPNWKCRSCTLLNTNNENFCEVCNTNRNGTPSKQLQHSQIHDYQAKKLIDTSPAEKEIPVDNKCFLCGKDDNTTHCKYCNKKSFCDACLKKYHNHPHRQWHLDQLETKNAIIKTFDAEFISVDNSLSQLNDKMNKHQEKSFNIMDEIKNSLTTCYSKLNQQLEKIDETKLEIKQKLSKEKILFNEDEEKQFKNTMKNLKQKFNERKHSEWIAIGEEMKVKYQREFNNNWAEKAKTIKISNKGEVKSKVKLTKQKREFEQQTANGLEQKIIGMRVVWQSKLDEEWEEYLTQHREKHNKQMQEKWKTKKKNVGNDLSCKAIYKIYRETLGTMNNTLEEYQLKQRKSINELKEIGEMQNILNEQVESVKQKNKKYKLESLQLNQAISEAKIKIKENTNKITKLDQHLFKKTTDFEKNEKRFKDREQRLQEMIQQLKKTNENIENEWYLERKKLESEKDIIQNSMLAWRTKYYEEQNQFLQTIQIFDSNECKLKKNLEKSQRLVSSLIQEKEILSNDKIQLTIKINAIEKEFEINAQKYKKELLLMENICRIQNSQISNKSDPAHTFRTTSEEQFERRHSNTNNPKKSQLELEADSQISSYFDHKSETSNSSIISDNGKSHGTVTSKAIEPTGLNYSDYKRETSISSKGSVFGKVTSFGTIIDKSIEPSGSNYSDHKKETSYSSVILDNGTFTDDAIGPIGSNLKLKQELQSTNQFTEKTPDLRDEQKNYQPYKSESKPLAVKNLGKDDEEYSPLNKTFNLAGQSSTNIEKSLKDSKNNNTLPMVHVHSNLKFSGNYFQKRELQNSISMDDLPNPQETTEQLNNKSVSNLVGVDPTKKAQDNKPNNHAEHLETKDTTEKSKLEPKLPDSNDSSSDDYESA